jgi:diguanylate cyclase (GGDEF)-like protein
MTGNHAIAHDRGEAANALEYLGCSAVQLCSLLLTVEEGIQLWDERGALVYANRATWVQFGPCPERPIINCADLAGICRLEGGLHFPPEDFPVERVLATGAACLDVLALIPGPAPRWLRINAQPLAAAGATGGRGVISSTVDVTTLVEREHHLQHQAHFDALTLLPNRVLLEDRMKLALARCQRSGETMAVCLMDLDGFKAVNDTQGHKAGDRLLQEIARRLQDAMRSDDTAARLGGDEFALLLGGFKSPGQWEQALKRVLDAVAVPFSIDDNVVRVSASIGVTLFPGDVDDADRLLRHADQAMYKAKQAGKNRFHIFDPAVESRVRANLGILKRIDDALAKGQFCLHYQPKVDCRNGRVVGMEALVRWNHPVLGLRAPGEFLPLIEREDIVIHLGEWVIGTALAQLDAWSRAGLDLTVSVNIAARQFLHGNFDERLAELLAAYPPELVKRFEIEIVETAALEDINTVAALIERYRAMGVTFALDDFGTGYSSLVHLKRLGADELKVDQTFVRDMLDDPGDLAIVQGVIGLATAFQCRVVAEGVESIEQTLLLLELGCAVMQGYGIARPLPAERVPDWVQAFRADPRWRMANSQYPLRSDFELLLMEVSHRHWFERMRQGAAHATTGKVDLPPVDYAGCRLAQWYADAGSRRYGMLAEFREIDALHRQVHRLAETVRACLTSGQPGLAHEAEEALATANDELVSRLHLFRVAMSGADGQH